GSGRAGGSGRARRTGRGATRRLNRRRGPDSVDERVDYEVRLDLREARRRGLREVDRVDREQPPGRVERAVTNVDEVAQPVEQVGQLVEVALELDGDRDRLVAGQCDGDRRRRDLRERDAAVLSDLVELEQDPGHVGLVGHRLGQADYVGDPDV